MALRALSGAPQRAIIYLRQSTYKEESISLEMQETACRDYCDRMGYTVVSVKDDPGITGRTWKRRGVVETMQMIESREADVIVLWKWSRLSRNRKDWALAIDKTDIAGGRIEAATEPIDVATASGRFARGVMTEFSVYQSELIGEVWEDVRQRRLRHGLPASGRLPFGWRWVKGAGIELNPIQAPYVVEMYRRYLAGEGAASISRWLNDEGVPAPNGGEWARTRPLTVMDSPIHAGKIPYRGKIVDGAHDALIDPQTWDAYRSERERRTTRGSKPRRSDYLLSGLMRCTCGARMPGKGAVTAGKWYGGYICTSQTTHLHRKYLSALTVEPVVEAWLLRFEVDVHLAASTATRSAHTRALREASELEGELSALARQNARGILPDATFERASAEVRADLAIVTARIARLATEIRSSPAESEIATLRAGWLEMTTAARNRALAKVVDRVELHPVGATLWTTWGISSPLNV